MILHVVNTSPFQTNALEDCLFQMSGEDQLLLIEDAVVASCADIQMSKQLALLSEAKRLWVLSDDLSARGLTPKIGLTCDYQQFVALASVTKSQIAW
jgi:tRNA 2-thiouridine synthesizing protein B